MLAYPCVGFEDYGFKSGGNAIVTSPEDAGTNARWLRNNSNAAERIASAAQKMMRVLHTLDLRVTSFAECLRRLDKGQLAGAEFRDGRFEIW